MRRFWILAGWLVLCLPMIHAEPGDIESSHDYPGFPRLTGFVISDFDEDDPAAYDFPVSRPLPTDADHIESVHVRGHRYIIRYELSPGSAQQSLLRIQEYYEKLAADGGFTVEKSGAVHDVTETFRRNRGGLDTWVHLEPGMTVNTLTIVESNKPITITTTPVAEDPLYVTLTNKGRVILPIVFLPGKPDVSTDAQPLINRVVKIMQRHPELLLTIEGYTDAVGEPSDNQRLSSDRARAVRVLLTSQGVEKGRLQSIGMGGAHPLADDATAEGREKNRRIELVVRTVTVP